MVNFTNLDFVTVTYVVFSCIIKSAWIFASVHNEIVEVTQKPYENILLKCTTDLNCTRVDMIAQLVFETRVPSIMGSQKKIFFKVKIKSGNFETGQKSSSASWSNISKPTSLKCHFSGN